METRQMTPLFYLLCPALFVTFIFVFENSRSSFAFGPPLAHSGPQNTSILGKSYRLGQPSYYFGK